MDSNLFFLPPLDYFTSKNAYTGSSHNFNYKITPEEELHALVWYGKMCSDKSEIAAEAFFPVTEEGRAALLQWLEKEFARCPQ